ncbi:hypothetical protein EVJ58_g8022 [Rhodofomes roseus]|uniref:IRG-type G domain-containing protein n=1 Tax=Rhodofomes roseus TaxID=34475 RepID=A0A4Y9Y053_9APHY|nr:hypothetical protein EVJ58_g8022 [Rhodofomes roseus]
MGSAISAIGSAVRASFEAIRTAFGLNKTKRNPTMEDMEDLMDENAKSNKAGRWGPEEYYSERFYQDRMNARESQRRARQAERDAEFLWQERMNAREEQRRARREQEEWTAAEKMVRMAGQRRPRTIEPLSIPTAEEYYAAKQRLQYEEGYIHFAIAGVAGSGKSSLLNAFLGKKSSDGGAAPTGTSETTMTLARYGDPHLDNPFVWYDFPGAGTLRVPGDQYFIHQALYAFDAIIVLFDNRFTEVDLAILKNAKLFNIPTYIARSKAHQQVSNVLNDMPTGQTRRGARREARDQYDRDTRNTVKKNLREAGLPDQRVYIVDKDNLYSIVEGQREPSDDDFDEWELLQDLLGEARRRRVIEEEGE